MAGRFVVVLLCHHLRLTGEDAIADDPKDPPLENTEDVQRTLFDAGGSWCSAAAATSR